jgi:alpha-beta hydrolase superfamily lysophospholipase
MDHLEGTFKGYGGVELYYQRWRPETGSAPKAVLVIVHGHGEHSARLQDGLPICLKKRFVIQ